MVFAKRSQCPICGAAKPSSSTGRTSTERMSGAVYRRYQPANRDVSPGRDSRSARRYMVCSESVGPSCAAPCFPTDNPVGVGCVNDRLQVENSHREVRDGGVSQRAQAGRSVDKVPGVPLESCFDDLEVGLWKPAGASDFVHTAVVSSRGGFSLSMHSADSIHGSPFEASDPISDFPALEDSGTGMGHHMDEWGVSGKRMVNDCGEGGVGNCEVRVSPTIPFCVREQVYVPLSFNQCVEMILAGPPVGEETNSYVSHPDSCCFFFEVGRSLVIHHENLTPTRQGVEVVCDQGQWSGQCVMCFRDLSACQGCLPPRFVDQVAPPEELPASLECASAIFDLWKLREVRGLKRIQSFAFEIVEEMLASVCWKAVVEGRTVFVVFDQFWMSWITPKVGFKLAVLDARLCGVYDGLSVFFVAREGFSFLVRQWIDEDTRCLELFAGVGGWSEALTFVDDGCGIVSIEIDTCKALVLSKMRGCQAVPLDAIMPDMSSLDIVVIGDVRDRRWLKLTLGWPFRVLMMSPPCTSFSGGGNCLGIHDENGQLMLHGLGIAAVVNAEVSCGENVKGLIRHPHWALIGLFAHMLGLRNLRVKLLELSHIVPMKRPRCFFCFFRVLLDFPINEATALNLPAKLWQISETFVQGISEEQERVLAQWELLPFSLKKLCGKEAEKVLDARTYDKLPLPVLMSSYMRQHLLPWSSLCGKGLFTWLVRFGQLRRYLHPCEAARLFGFGPAFPFGEDVGECMAALGNCVAPIQVLQILRPIFQKLGILKVLADASLREVIALMVCGWAFLGNMAVRRFGPELRFAQKVFAVADQEGQVLVRHHGTYWWVSSRGLFTEGANIRQVLSQILGLGKKIDLLRCLLFEDVIEVHVEFEPVLLRGVNFTLGVSPLLTWKECLVSTGQELGLGELNAIRPDVPAWMVPAHKLEFPFWFLVEDEVVFLSKGQRRAVEWQAEQNVSFFLRKVFPFPVAAKFAHVRNVVTNEWIGCEDEIGAGYYQVDFRLCEVPIQPIGRIQVHPLATVGEVQSYLSARFFGGRAVPMITVGGRSVSHDALILAANCTGVLRLRLFPLKGGALSLVATEERLRELLREHGVPDEELAQRVTTLVEKVSYEVCKRCLDSKTPWAALKVEATKHDVRLVTVLERERKSASSTSLQAKDVDPLQVNDPWKGAGVGRGKKHAKDLKAPKSANLKIDGSFFHVQGKELPVISIGDLLKGASGLVVEQLHAIGERLPVILQRSRTTGPAALIVCGCSVKDLPKELVTSKCSDVVVPGWVGPHSSAIRSVLVQVGDVEVQYKTAKADMVVQDHVATKVVMIHVYRDESAHWDELQRGTAFYLRKLGFQETKMIQQAWGLGFYAGNKRVGVKDAAYAHGFVRILEAFVEPLLQFSGADGMYATPRTSARTVDPAYKVITFPGFNLEDAKRQKDMLDDVMGLVRTSKGYGVRVHESKYSSTKRALFPDLEASDESDSGGPRRFRLLAVPAEYERTTLKALLRKVGWAAKVLRGQGFGTWLVSSVGAPPVRSIVVNEATIVILEDQAHAQGAILASSSRTVVTKTAWQVVPHEGQTCKAAPLLPEVKTKFEQLEAKAMSRVDNLEQQVSALAAQVKENAGQTQNALQSLEGKVEHVAKMEDRFEQLLKRFGQQNEQRVQRLEDQQQATLNEIKMAIEQSPKVRKVDTQGHP